MLAVVVNSRMNLSQALKHPFISPSQNGDQDKQAKKSMRIELEEEEQNRGPGSCSIELEIQRTIQLATKDSFNYNNR